MAQKASLLSHAEYGRSRKARGLSGGTQQAVSKAVREGRITGFGPDKLIDPELADAQWERNTRARVNAQSSAATPDDDLVAQAAGPAPAAAPLPHTAPAAAVPDTGYTEARARREKAEAERSEIELKKLRGDLVSWQDVQRGGYEVARELRDTMDSAVSALAAEIASLGSAEACAEVIRRHNRAVCEVLVKGWREKIGPLPEGGLA